MTKEEQFDAIYPYFLAVVNAYYTTLGDLQIDTNNTLERLKEKAKELDLSVELAHNGEDLILIVEKPEEYVIVSADLDIYTYQDEEDECQ